MRAVVIDDGTLVVDERPDPEPVADQVLVRVTGAGVNRADLLQRAGVYPAPPGAPADIPGLEFAGRVAAVGPDARGLQQGDLVCGIVAGGGQADLVLTRAPLVASVPDGVDPVVAGGLPEALVTAHDALVGQAGLRSGERLLIHAVGSGVGVAALQYAKAVGCEVVGTSRTADKLERAADLGLDHGVHLPDGPDLARADDLRERVGPVDVVLDLVGGDYVPFDVRVCRTSGRIMLVGLVAGARATLSLGELLSRRVRLTGTVLRARPDHEKAAATAAFARQVLPLVANGAIRPVVETVVPLDDAQSAYDLVASNTTFGKVILEP